MKKCLAIVAVCLMAAPAMAGEIPQNALTDLGLGGMEVMTDAQGMQVRGKSSRATVSGTSLVFGQLVADLPTGTNFFVGSDVNHYWAQAQNAEMQSMADGDQGSGVQGALTIDIDGTQAFNGTFQGFGGGAAFNFNPAGITTFGGFANAFAN